VRLLEKDVDVKHFFKELLTACSQPKRKVERQVKVLTKNFFLCPSKQFLPILFQILL